MYSILSWNVNLFKTAFMYGFLYVTNKKTGVGNFVLNFIVLEQSSKVPVKCHCSRTCVCM